MRNEIVSQLMQKLLPMRASKREAQRQERRRDLLLDSPRTLPAFTNDPQAQDALFAQKPVWQGKRLLPPMRSQRETQPPQALLPPELWGNIIEQLVIDNSALAPDALLDLRRCSRYFAYLVDTYGIDYFAKTALKKCSLRQLIGLPRQAVDSLFAQQRELVWDVAEPSGAPALRHLLAGMVQLTRLDLRFRSASLAGVLGLPASLRHLELNSFDLTANPGFFAALPDSLEHLVFRAGKLPALHTLSWPARLRTLVVESCEWEQGDVLDLSAQSRLQTLSCTSNQLRATNVTMGSVRVRPPVQALTTLGSGSPLLLDAGGNLFIG